MHIFNWVVCLIAESYKLLMDSGYNPLAACLLIFVTVSEEQRF